MKGMKDWNKMTTEEYIEHLENKFRFNSSGTAKAIFELIAAYKALTIPAVTEPLKFEEKTGLDWINDETDKETLSANFRKDKL